MKVVEEFLRLDKLQKREKLDSTAIIHSMILRMRGFFLIQCLLKNRKYTNSGFRSFLNKKGLPNELVESFYGVYCSERDGRKTSVKISVADAERLYNLAKWNWTKRNGL